MKRIRKFYRRMKYKVTKALDGISGGRIRAADFRSAKDRLLLSGTLSKEEKALLEKVSLSVHRNDDMYVYDAGANHYLSVGLSAIRCINRAIDSSQKEKEIRSILDFPCGHGRVLRFLRVRFPDAEITASEIDPTGLDFCGREFSVKTVLSDKDFSKVPLAGPFDLIWCGSLVTHLEEKAATDLLKFFHGLLANGGLLVFTTHGLATDREIQNRANGSPANGRTDPSSPQQKYRYEDYKKQKGYGTSIVSREHMLAVAKSVGKWKNSFFLERGWDGRQDVYGYTKEE